MEDCPTMEEILKYLSDFMKKGGRFRLKFSPPQS